LRSPALVTVVVVVVVMDKLGRQDRQGGTRRTRLEALRDRRRRRAAGELEVRPVREAEGSAPRTRWPTQDLMDRKGRSFSCCCRARLWSWLMRCSSQRWIAQWFVHSVYSWQARATRKLGAQASQTRRPLVPAHSAGRSWYTGGSRSALRPRAEGDQPITSREVVTGQVRKNGRSSPV
jgi:hypothetical protein